MAFKDSTDEKFSNQIGGSKLSLIQFSASWCGPCQQLKPIIEKISNDISDKIDCYYHDIESQPNEPTKYSVRGVPTILSVSYTTSPSPRDVEESRMPSSA